jgi:uncharacterized protein YoxC
MTVEKEVAVPLHTFEAAISILMVAIALIVILIYPTLQMQSIEENKEE